MAAPSPVGDVKIVSPVSTFVLNTLALKESPFFLKKKNKSVRKKMALILSKCGTILQNKNKKVFKNYDDRGRF